MDQPARRVFRGREGADESIREWTRSWEDYRYEPREFLAVDDQRVLVVGRQSGRGRDSRVEVESPICHLWTVRDGQVVEMHMFLDESEAFRAAGLAR